MSEPVIKCESVYKIFGTNADKMLKEANGNVDAKTFQENGCILTKQPMKVSGYKQKNMVKELRLGLMDIFMRENLKIVNGMELEH